MSDKPPRIFEEEKFYNLAQSYRCLPISKQDRVLESFDEMQDFIEAEMRRYAEERLREFAQKVQKKIEKLRSGKYPSFRHKHRYSLEKSHCHQQMHQINSPSTVTQQEQLLVNDGGRVVVEPQTPITKLREALWSVTSFQEILDKVKFRKPERTKVLEFVKVHSLINHYRKSLGCGTFSQIMCNR